MRLRATAALLAAVLALTPASVPAQSALCPATETAAGRISAAARGSLYCMDLVPVPEFAHMTALLELHIIAAGGTIALTANGHHRYQLVSVIDSLPAPASLGPFTAFVAWATSISMDTIIRLGEVKAGRTQLGELQLDQFRILISAEAHDSVQQRSGRLVLRGTSPGTRLMAHRDVTRSGPMGNAPLAPTTGTTHQHGDWPMPPMDPRMPAMPGMDALRPDVAPWLPTVPDTAALPQAQPRQLLRVGNGDTIRLEAGIVRRQIGGRTIIAYAFNRQYPGPLIHVRQQTTVTIDFRNTLDQPSTIHWHGIRLDNRFDGVPHLTQEPVPPGGRFLYTVRFPDAGIYWYHPHHREDTQQDLGLYGNILVDHERPDAYGPAHRSEVLMLDDLLLGDQGLIPFGVDTPTHALMGRFGNVFLVNGEPSYRLQARTGEVVRYFLTNASNTRPLNMSFGDARIKLVGSDVGRYEREEWIPSVVLAPAERAIVDVRFDRAGRYLFANRVRALNHAYGTYYQETDTLGFIEVNESPAAPDLSSAFLQLRRNSDVTRDIDAYRSDFARPPDREITLSMRVQNLPPITAAMATGFPVPVDWNDGMGMMNWATTGRQITWIVRDAQSRRENMDVVWTFRRGDRMRLRIHNDDQVFHAMAHPIHLHGQRLLLLSRNGQPVTNHAWKDTALVQAGETVDLLVEMSNPGRWMLHCHIAEHLSAGMMMVFQVN